MGTREKISPSVLNSLARNGLGTIRANQGPTLEPAGVDPAGFSISSRGHIVSQTQNRSIWLFNSLKL